MEELRHNVVCVCVLRVVCCVLCVVCCVSVNLQSSFISINYLHTFFIILFLYGMTLFCSVSVSISVSVSVFALFLFSSVLRVGRSEFFELCSMRIYSSFIHLERAVLAKSIHLPTQYLK